MCCAWLVGGLGKTKELEATWLSAHVVAGVELVAYLAVPSLRWPSCVSYLSPVSLLLIMPRLPSCVLQQLDPVKAAMLERVKATGATLAPEYEGGASRPQALARPPLLCNASI